MKIINPSDKHIEFVELNVGDCFMFDNCLFVKINPIKEKGYEKAGNAFCFVDNNITHVPEPCLVLPVEAEVVIRSRGVN